MIRTIQNPPVKGSISMKQARRAVRSVIGQSLLIGAKEALEHAIMLKIKHLIKKAKAL